MGKRVLPNIYLATDNYLSSKSKGGIKRDHKKQSRTVLILIKEKNVQQNVNDVILLGDVLVMYLFHGVENVGERRLSGKKQPCKMFSEITIFIRQYGS